MPTAEQIREYYARNYRDGRLRPMVEEAEMTRLRAETRLSEVRPFLKGDRWLDVGCSSGAFVAEARRAGINAEGTELAQEAVDEAVAAGLPVRQGPIESVGEDGEFDVVTAFDVLEHVADPAAFMHNARRLLKPGGMIALSVPNLSSVTRRMMGKRWYFYIPDSHLFYFNPENMGRFLERHGFAVLHTARTTKQVTAAYAVTQLEAHNPLLYSLARPIVGIMPKRIADGAVPLHLGEILVVAKLGAAASTNGQHETGERDR